MRKVQFWSNVFAYDRVEWNYRVGAGRCVDAVNLAPVGDHDFLAVGRKGITRKQIACERSLLVVALHGILQPTLLAAREIVYSQRGLSVIARAINQLSSVGRNDRSKRIAERFGNCIFLAGDQVPADDLSWWEIRVEQLRGIGTFCKV